MSLIDFLSFVGSFGLFIYLMIRRAVSEKNRRLHPELEEEERRNEERELKQLMRSLDLDEEDEDFPEELKALPPPPQIKKKDNHTWAEVPRSKSNWEAAPAYVPPKQVTAAGVYEVEGKTYDNRSKNIIKEIPELRNMLVYYEIFGPPKAFRDD